MAPIVLQVVRALDRNPLPYLVAVATASNCGSVATITGNPQNMVIGTLSRVVGQFECGGKIRHKCDYVPMSGRSKPPCQTWIPSRVRSSRNGA
jgi:hypothetical protein